MARSGRSPSASTRPVASGSTPPGPARAAADLNGRRWLGRYRVCEKLGEGGMGAVYRGEDPTDGTVVALKVVSQRGGKLATAVQRFRKEARLLAEVGNPFVTRL